MIYYSAPNCDILLRGRDEEGKVNKFVSMEQAYALNATRGDTVMPYYSWSSRRVKEFINGPVIVQGTLLINVKDKYYLQNLIRGYAVPSTTEALKRVEDEINLSERILTQQFSEEGTDVTSPENTSFFVDLARRRLDYLKMQNKANTREFSDEASEDAWEQEVDLVVMGPNEEIKDEITGVRFTGKSFEINAGSAGNIKYAFPFVARDATL